ncbi:metalloregulator ArsR/SmtB family transcription factor [Streptomyces sp. 549]|uniref:ArsR/SmtB family transcription factor n=1 Tax=Streptomyces sp. 549 TaxID=3049076 RepID=UPI0024C39CCD|nr:metalloregulator ArsR/SmtB family transcription factor [Streptomyces sp. 549]MDK1472244.1 metalloregulator ArsR/SmtB family transcription factor [Streptomyces sp. 549]
MSIAAAPHQALSQTGTPSASPVDAPSAVPARRPGSEAGGAEDCVTALAGSLMDREEAEAMAQSLKAVADPTRLQLLHLIKSAPGGEACVCDLTECLGLRQPTISHHLKILVAAGLLTRERRGTWSWFAVDPKGLEALRRMVG